MSDALYISSAADKIAAICIIWGFDLLSITSTNSVKE